VRAVVVNGEATFDSIEHGCYLDEDPELIPMMAERGTFFVPTLTVYVFHREVSAPHVRARGRELYPHHIASVQKALNLPLTRSDRSPPRGCGGERN